MSVHQAFKSRVISVSSTTMPGGIRGSLVVRPVIVRIWFERMGLVMGTSVGVWEDSCNSRSRGFIGWDAQEGLGIQYIGFRACNQFMFFPSSYSNADRYILHHWSHEDVSQSSEPVLPTMAFSLSCPPPHFDFTTSSPSWLPTF